MHIYMHIYIYIYVCMCGQGFTRCWVGGARDWGKVKIGIGGDVWPGGGEGRKDGKKNCEGSKQASNRLKKGAGW
jgi:hypothetical protein